MPSPLIKAMIEQYDYPVSGLDNTDEFIQSQQECVLFFYRESNTFPGKR